MTMRRNNFKAVAEIIRHYKLSSEIQDPSKTMSKRELMFHLTDRLASYFKQDNPAFNRELFMKACGWYN